MKNKSIFRFIITVAMLTLLVGLLAVSASATSRNVASGTEFAAAMEQAKNGEIDTIILTSNITSTYSSFYPAATRNVTIKSADGYNYTISSTNMLEIGITSGAYQYNTALRANVTFQNVTFDLNSSQRAFYVNANGGVLNLDGVTIKNGKRTNNNGGAIAVFGEANLSNVTISNCSVESTGTKTASLGGAIYVNGGALTINGGTISNCSSTGSGTHLGGAIYAENSSVSISDCTISGCSSYRGGAVYVTGSDLTLSGMTINNNTAAFQGGGIYAIDSSIVMQSGTISGNTATENMGGGVALNSSYFTMNGGSISGNTAATSGGNVMLSVGSTFDYYYSKGASVTGGSITTTTGWPNSTDFILQNETADDNTLNVYMKDLTSGNMTVDSSAAPSIHNRIDNTGGTYYGNYNLIYTVPSSIELSSTWSIAATKPATQTQGTSSVAPVFNYIIRGGDNVVISAASGATFTTNGYLGSSYDMVAVESNSVVTFENITLDANKTSGLRALYLKSGADVTLEKGILITGGNSGSWGGGVFVNKSTLTLSGGAINNNVGTYGGGVVLVNGATMNIYSGEMTGNTAANRGGAIHLQDGTASVAGSTLNMYGGNIHANYSQSSSGGAVNMGNSVSTAYNVFNMYGGAIYDHLSGGQGAVAVRTLTVFNMYGGEIYGNARGLKQSDGSMAETNNRGGAIWIYGGTVNMLKDTTGMSTSIPTIRDNRSTYGMAMDIENGTANLTYGLITGNIGNMTDSTGYGAIWAEKGTLTIGGDINIYGNRNTTRDQEENIYVKDSSAMTLKVSSPINGKVGVYSKDATTAVATCESGLTNVGGLFVDNSTKPLGVSGTNIVILDGTAYYITALHNGEMLQFAGSDTLTVNYSDLVGKQGTYTETNFLGIVDVSDFGTDSVKTNALYRAGDAIPTAEIVGDLYAVWVKVDTLGAASAKVDTNSGLKFITTVESSVLESIGIDVKSASASGDGYSRGMLLGVVGKNNLVLDGTFALNVPFNSTKWLSSEVYETYTKGNFPLSNGSNAFSVSLVYESSDNYNKAVSFRGYITVTVGGVSSTVYSDFNSPTLENGDDVTYTLGQHARSARAVIRSLYFKGTEAEAQTKLGSNYSTALDIAGYTWDGYNTSWMNSATITQTSYTYQPTISLLKNTSVYGKNLVDQLANVTKSSRTISGSIGYASNYSGYTNALSDSAKNISIADYANGKYGYGYFLSLRITAPVTDYTTDATIELACGTDRRTVTGAISNGYVDIACRITPESDSLILRCDWDGTGTNYETCVSVLDLTGLTFENRSGMDAIRELALAYDRRGAWVQYETFSMSYTSALVGLDTVRISTSAIPEVATSNNILYLDCAGFINAVYTHAIGTALGNRESIDIVTDTTNRMYYYEVTRSETDAEKAAIMADFEAILQPGDLIAYSYYNENSPSKPTDGHTMIYLGDGMMIHCEAGSGGVFIDGIRHTSATGLPYDVEELTGAITYESIYDTLLNNSNARGLFNTTDAYNKAQFAIIRPLDSDETITTQAGYRLNNLPGVVIEKTSSHPVGVTADRGEQITITFKFTNTASTGCSFTLESALPSGTTLVNGSLTQVIALSAGETKTVSFTVQVNSSTAYGTELNFTSLAGNLTLNTCTTVVGKGLTTAQRNTITGLLSSGYSFTSTNSFALMKEVYDKAGYTLTLGGATSIYELWDDIFKLNGSSYVEMTGSTSSAGYKMLAPNLYGGCRLFDAKETPRIKKLTTEALLPGDVIIFTENPSATLSSLSSYCNLYIYMGNDTFITYDGGVQTFTADGKTRTSHTGSSAVKFLDDKLTQLFGSSAFAVLRPSLY